MKLRSPVVLFVYNRTTYLPAILKRIRASQPTKLYVFGDGPKDDPEDRTRCARVRSAITERRWPFPAKLAFAPTNLGNYRRFVSGIDEVFAHEDRAIFLDDDIELSQSFFPYCDCLLDAYACEERVAMICGVNPLASWPTADAICLFSKLGNAQAWATWRRAWRLFKSAADLWPRPQTQIAIAEFLGDPELFAWRAAIHAGPINSEVDTWDTQWALARHAQQTLCAVPAQNLVIHRGRGPLATHVKTRSILDAIAELHEIAPPFRAPTVVTADDAFDRLYFEATQNKLSASSARWLAKRLMARNHNLLAIALLRHAAATAPPDPKTAAMIAEAASRVPRA
jgi:hypothetical protein